MKQLEERLGRTNDATIASKFWIGTFRHAMPWPRGNVYRNVRMMLGLSQSQAAKAFGVSVASWKYRERMKRMYHVAELLALHELSGLTADNYLKLLKEVA